MKDQLLSEKDEIEVFFELVQKEYVVYEKMFALSEEAVQHILNDDISSLQRTLASKQQYLYVAADLEKEMRPFKKVWEEKRSLLPADKSEAIKAFFDAFKVLMERLIKQEMENEELLKERAVEKKKQANILKQGKQLGRAYSAYGENIPRVRYMDQRS